MPGTTKRAPPVLGTMSIGSTAPDLDSLDRVQSAFHAFSGPNLPLRVSLLAAGETKVRFPTIVPQDQNSHFIPDNPKKKVVAKYPKIRASKVLLEESEAAWSRRDSIFGSLYFGKEPIPQLKTAFPIEMVQSDPKVRLNCPMKIELHRPTSRRSCSQVIEVFGSRTMSLSRR